MNQQNPQSKSPMMDDNSLKSVQESKPNDASEESSTTEEDTWAEDFQEEDVVVFESTFLAEDIDKKLATQLNHLSIGERENLLQDIHGLGRNKDFDDPNFLAARLQEFEYWINNKCTGYPAYTQALLQSPQYVLDRKFRLKFLRSKGWDSKEAALLMLRHFEWKLRLFGPSALGRDIRLKDFSEDDMECIRHGAIQRLGRDHAGRIVVLYLTHYAKFQTFENQLRTIFYTAMTVWNDEITHKKGNVVVCYSIPPPSVPENLCSNISAKNRLDFIKLVRAIPKMPSAIHFCASNKLSYAFMSATTARFISNDLFLRSRIHCGCRSEIKEALKTFGIPASSFPVDSEDGSLDLKNHCEWLEMQLLLELGRTPLLQPVANDVLFGRGRPYQDHQGNIRLRVMIESYLAGYEQAGRKDKMAIAAALVEEVKSNGGRFLRKETGFDAWVVVADEVARKKISHDFRTLRSANSTTKQT